YHNSRPIKESSDVKFEFEGDRCSLIIFPSRQPHQGSYHCKAVNPAGEATSSCKLVVLQKATTPDSSLSRDGTPTTSMQVARLGSTGGPARITRPLTDIHAKHGEKVKLIIGIECDPVPEVIWSFQGRPILLDGDYVFDHFNSSYILELPRATVDHAGTYSVEVRNASGSQHSTCRVTVEPLPEDSLALVPTQEDAGDIVST
ncbi:titin-like, partial [Tropilaelaps mercedesae]